MLPSNNPIIANYTDQSLVYHKPFINNDPLFSTLCNFPSSPFFHFESENDEFLPQPCQDLPFLTTTDSTNNPITELEPNVINNNMVDSNKNFSTPPRKRTCKKDRHSKINTAQGPRDRRMRLSLEIAREFFGLQDILGYDKASRTVEWLLSKAKSDIKNLVANKSGGRLIHTVDSDSVVGTKSASSASECEVISGIDHGRVIHAEKPSKCVNKEKTNRLREVRKVVFRPARARESREKARARARERTTVKRSVKSKLFAEDATTNQDSNQVGSSWSPVSFEVQLAEVEKPNSHEGQHIAAMADMVDDDHSLVIMDKFNYLQGSTGISQEPHQFEDFQFYGKLWESYNIQSLL